MPNINFKLTLMTEADFDDVLEIFFEPDAFKYISGLLDQSREYYLNFLSDFVKKIQDGSAYYWVMRDVKDGKLIGAINLNKIKNSQDMQIGWQVGANYQRQGLAFSGAQKAIEFAIKQTDIDVVYGVFHVENVASERILAKLGFKLESLIIEDGNLLHRYILKIDR